VGLPRISAVVLGCTGVPYVVAYVYGYRYVTFVVVCLILFSLRLRYVTFWVVVTVYGAVAICSYVHPDLRLFCSYRDVAAVAFACTALRLPYCVRMQVTRCRCVGWIPRLHVHTPPYRVVLPVWLRLPRITVVTLHYALLLVVTTFVTLLRCLLFALDFLRCCAFVALPHLPLPVWLRCCYVWLRLVVTLLRLFTILLVRLLFVDRTFHVRCRCVTLFDCYGCCAILRLPFYFAVLRSILRCILLISYALRYVRCLRAFTPLPRCFTFTFVACVVAFV